MVQKLENKVRTEKTHQQSVIQFETNEHLKGLEFMDDIYQAIIRKKPLHVTYQSFKARHPQSFNFHPQLLKEFRNRWFVLGFKNKKQSPLLLALDRMQTIAPADGVYVENTKLNLQEYFKNVAGVSMEEDGIIERVELFVVRDHAPYVLTKPLHHSQQLMKRLSGGVVISLDVQLTFELEKELLGLGETIKILKPDRLVRRLKKRVAIMHQLYSQDLHPMVARETIKKVDRRGTAILEGIYSPQEIQQTRQAKEPVICEAEAGGIHLMKPLTLHASGKTSKDQSRRVIHLEFASINLPDGLMWAEKEII